MANSGATRAVRSWRRDAGLAEAVTDNPRGIGVNETDLVTIATTSTMVTAPSRSLTSKTPAPVLLVDDDRWYPVEDRYKEAFIAKGIPLTCGIPQSGQGATTTSPLTTTLSMYPVTVWFTGYDWYAPVTDVEIQRLMAYLDGGGRLLLSSQDFVYHHEGEPLTRRRGYWPLTGRIPQLRRSA